MNAYDAQYPHTSGVALRGVWIVHECTGSALNVRAVTVHTPARISSCVPTKYVYVLVGVQAMYMYVRTYVRSGLSTKKYGSTVSAKHIEHKLYRMTSENSLFSY